VDDREEDPKVARRSAGSIVRRETELEPLIPEASLSDGLNLLFGWFM
jgi:hypothetical protein